MPRSRRTFTSEFKLQMVQLYENGKSRSDLCREYDLTPSALDKWIKQYQQS
ncbi:transposase [Priestia endophytica]|uniref:transposase n=1 Tax=Priestia endophytica TaxID=135735 RepID=UPI003AF26972